MGERRRNPGWGGLNGFARRAWLPVATAALALGAALCVAWAVEIAIGPPGPPQTDGAGLAFLGAATWAVLFTAGAIALPLLIRSERRRKQRTRPPQGWYADPYREAPWRWWDGSHWTSHKG